MKILQLVQKPQGRGVEIFTSQLADHLVRLGHEVKVVTVFPGTYALPFSGEILTLNGRPELRFFDLPAWKSLANIVGKWQPDIVQANAGDTLKYAVFSKLIFGWKAPIIFRNASMPSLYLKNSKVKLFNGWLYRYVSGVASVSAASYEDFRNSYVAKREGLHQVLPIGIDPEKIGFPFSSIEKNEIMVHVGGFTFEKDHISLLQLFKNVLASRPRSQLWLFGEGPLKEKVERFCWDLGIQNQVFFKGNRHQPFSEIPTHAIFILPSKIEGLPAVILESFYAKIPVIAYGMGGIPEILKNGKTGWCIPPGKTNDFLEAIEHVLSLDDFQSNQILSNAYQLVKSSFTIEKIAVQFEKFYKEFQSAGQKS